MYLTLDHIAILTTSLERSAKNLPPAFVLEQPETHPAEGTREQYALLDSVQEPAILLLEPIQPGPYQRALKKRGPGLHHLGISTDAIDEAIAHLYSKGLLLHPTSLKTYAHDCVWMCRPGIPFLIELFRPPEPKKVDQGFVGIDIPGTHLDDKPLPQIVPNLQLQLHRSQALTFTIAQHAFTIAP